MISSMCQISFEIFFMPMTLVYLSGRDLCALINIMNTESKLILHWLKANRLILNTGKTFYGVSQRKKKMSWQHRSIH